MKERECEKLDMIEASNFAKYLGFPLKHKGASRRQFNFVADRVMNKFAEWKIKFLSFASRAVLVKSVMLAIPNYIMQGVALPVHLSNKLDKISRDFLWALLIKSINYILWDGKKSLNPKKRVGWGFR